MTAKIEAILQEVAKRPSLVHIAISSHLRKLGYPEKSILSMEKCGSLTGYTAFKECKCGVQLVGMQHRCNLRTCPVCSKRRKRRIFNRFLPFFKNYHVTRAEFFQFLTISPRNYKNLAEGFEHIRKSFSKFVRRKYVKERVRAGFYVIETKEKEDGTWNIHIHAVLYGRWLDYRLRGKCLDCEQNLLKFDKIGKRFYCANKKCNSINVIRQNDTNLGREWSASAGETAHIYGERVKSVYGAVSYLTKYISANKDDFFSSESVAQYIYETRKRKLINAFGLFFKESKNLKNNPFICQKCKSPISFFFDMQAVSLIQNFEGPPDEPRTSDRTLSSFSALSQSKSI